jgi:hypothetical protein
MILGRTLSKGKKDLEEEENFFLLNIRFSWEMVDLRSIFE